MIGYLFAAIDERIRLEAVCGEIRTVAPSGTAWQPKPAALIASRKARKTAPFAFQCAARSRETT
jgi:hypothetical protein